jgi:rhombotail lipoprotein
MRRILLRCSILFVATLWLAACDTLNSSCFWGCSSHHTGSTPLVDFLYPQGEVPHSDATPELKLPLTVGLSFLPGRAGQEPLDARQKEEILGNIRQHFRSLSYVRDIVIISDGYLNTRGGFDSLQQLARLQQLDVIALVSYDQLAKRSENNRSLAYLTIVGAFLMHGSESQTSTLLDLAVVEPSTRSLLLRAAGTSYTSGSSTAVRQGAALEQQSSQGLTAAAAQLNSNLERELADFSERVRAGHGPVRVAQRGGGGAAFDALSVGALLGMTLLVIHRRRRRRARAAPGDDLRG